MKVKNLVGVVSSKGRPKNIVGVVLAAGEGTRMKSNTPKVLHKLWGKPILWHTISTLQKAGLKKLYIIIGYKSKLLKEYIAKLKSQLGIDVEIVYQDKLLGTADALFRTKKKLSKFNGTILVVCADAPLIKTGSLLKLIRFHLKKKSACSLLSGKVVDPTGYGRIIREDDEISEIVEEKDASVYQKAIDEISSGVFCFDSKKIFPVIDKLMSRSRKNKKEYYLTDALMQFKARGDTVSGYLTNDSSEILGINSRKVLALAHDTMKKRILEAVMARGVTLIDPNTTFIDSNVQIARDSIIFPFVFIETDVRVGKNCSIGPFCRLRSGTVIEDNARIGNFAEITRSRIGKQSKINHFSYIGDTTVGSSVNIGAGTVTANYDGKSKCKTHIKKGAFIGSGTILVAPVKVGRCAKTGAGSVIPKRKDVPDKSIVAGVPAKPLKT